MNTKLVLALALIIATPFASAYSILKTERYKGTVTEVNTDSRALTIELDSGKHVELELGAAADITRGEKVTNMEEIQLGEYIVYKREYAEEMAEVLEGEVLALDRENFIAKVRLANRAKVVKVQFSKDTAFFTSEKNISFSDLRRGHLIRASYPALQASLN